MPARRIDVITMGDDFATIALRAVLESWGIGVSLHLIATARQLVDLLGGEHSVSSVIVLMCHGVEAGIALPALAPEIEAAQPFHQALTPADIAASFRLPGATVISTGCGTGSAAFAAAFRSAGAAHYLAPAGDPPGALALMVALTVCYAHLVRGLPLSQSLRLAHAVDPDASLFMLS